MHVPGKGWQAGQPHCKSCQLAEQSCMWVIEAVINIVCTGGGGDSGVLRSLPRPLERSPTIGIPIINLSSSGL